MDCQETWYIFALSWDEESCTEFMNARSRSIVKVNCSVWPCPGSLQTFNGLSWHLVYIYALRWDDVSCAVFMIQSRSRPNVSPLLVAFGHVRKYVFNRLMEFQDCLNAYAYEKYQVLHTCMILLSQGHCSRSSCTRTCVEDTFSTDWWIVVKLDMHMHIDENKCHALHSFRAGHVLKVVPRLKSLRYILLF